MNRLKLNWTLSTSTERKEFVQQYISIETFISKPLSNDELETIANYILWGKNEEGKSIDQEGFVELPRKNSTWSNQNLESLDELTESATFNEASVYSLNSKLPTKKTRIVFSREETLKNSPPSLLNTYKSLWKEIDKTELTINYYELLHEKRTKEPRQELLSSLTEEEQAQCRERAKTLTQYNYLKLRHFLVELRREQYTLKDSFTERIQLHNAVGRQEEEVISFETDAPVYPLGVFSGSPTQQLIFQPFDKLIPENFTEDQLKEISRFIWSLSVQNTTGRPLHFTDIETVYQLFLLLEEFEEELQEASPFSTISDLLNTLDYYTKEAKLTEVQREILDLKIKKEKNQNIAAYINRKYGKSYTDNYISTIFRQKIIPAINEAAQFHEKIIQNLFFKEEFKVCIKCGRTLLRDPINFVRKSRAKDGLSNRCKDCDKKDREEKKQGGKDKINE